MLEKNDMDCTVVDARFLKPFDVELARSFAGRVQFVIEDHVVSGGVFSALNEVLSEVPHREIFSFAWSDQSVVSHGNVAELKRRAGLDAESIAEKISSLMQKS